MKRLESIGYLIIFAFFSAFFPHIAIAQDLKSPASVLEKINTYNNSLGSEITKIPGYQNSLNGKQLIALNRLESIMKNISPQQIHTLQSFLRVGIPAKRAYCTPLQAVLWILEKENDAQILQYTLEELLDKAWIFTESNRWNDYEVVTDRLNAPQLVNYYERIRFSYRSKRGKKTAKKGEPQKIFTNNYGNCDDTAALSKYCLKKAGYKAKVKNVHPRRWHTVCFYEHNGSEFIIDNGRPDKFLRRGIVPATEYKMYNDQINLKKIKGDDRDKIYKLQDNYALLLVYLIAHDGKAPDIETICKEIGLSGYEKFVKEKYIKTLISEGFISNFDSNKSGSEYSLNTSLCKNFTSERYHRPINASSLW
ncbi:MAG: hypothetical protein JRJ65_17995 [Deltaproteobacteria bacterium]|nr:hypothetical protein [Deltaproteobacteria bacterium]